MGDLTVRARVCDELAEEIMDIVEHFRPVD
jgi:hypothetical protein